MSDSKACSTMKGAAAVKTTVIPTEKALLCQIERLQKDCKARVNKMQGVAAALKELMKNNNAFQVQTPLDVLVQMCDDAMSLRESLMPLIIPQDEQHKQNAWFTGVNAYVKGFIEDVKHWPP